MFIYSVGLFGHRESVHTSNSHRITNLKETLLHCCISIVVIYPFQSHTMDYRMLPLYYCGIIKNVLLLQYNP